jgi:PAS domain S-box-containing protein
MSSPLATRDKPLLLVVDDDRLIRAMLRETLEREGFAVAEASDGIEALAAFERLLPTLVILDVEMPTCDGLAVCSEIRRRYPEDRTPIVIITSAEDRRTIDLAYEQGATDFISKPVNAALLSHRVRYLLRASRAFREAYESQASLATAQRIARLGSWEWDTETGEVYFSKQALRILGLPATDPTSDYETFVESVHPAERDYLRAQIRDSLERIGRFEVAHRLLRRDGKEKYVEQQGEIVVQSGRAGVWISGIIQDVTDKRVTQKRIRYLASYDSLTGLANRRLFHSQLSRAIAAASAKNHLVGLLYMDVDRFKMINDMLGHSIGDLALKCAGQRICEHVRGSDLVARIEGEAEPTTVSRMGGDEFTVLLSRIQGPEAAGEVAERILRAMQEPMTLEGREVSMAISIGIAIFPQDGEDKDTLLRHADRALYHAKEQGRNAFKFFSESMNRASMRKLLVQSRLREAIERDEFRVHYQPRINLRTGEVESLEALLRWHHPELGTVSPTEFIPLTEESGLIEPIGEWVLRSSCRDLAAWPEAQRREIRLSVNVSSRQFTSGALCAAVSGALRESGLDPSRLELELTERTLLQEDDRVVGTLHEIRAMGVQISLDDFGTGYSALGYLTRFPLDTLKLDRSLVRDLGPDPAETGVVGAVISMAHSLGLRVCAEGVDDDEQLQVLRELGCDEVQGFLYSGAVSASEVDPLLAGWHERAKR